MKIDKVINSQVASSTQRPSSPAQVETAGKAKGLEPVISVSNQIISQAQEKLADLPDIDMEKVNAVKQALAKGDLKLDIDTLSSAILEFHTGHE
ncbi:flagellar biosynthesis anti-sigma factor FlgM [Photobacterium sp. 2_MG-2023]|uniref:Negative regulator of flagellin synthesis n=1 Tax=Photobacterium arenosum TaxID=2774143 RepID=A0ABR9BNM0_9GAMM|nr:MULTISPECIES: flagellar biosynthesis anti-sigma factor FlgM [Photobacterium]MBD8513833.1 flagellar biosynthesis anti-sigma factor FlgM [Photobacterium arenosum]MDO6583441.1 flagellar biosynthesis anti-sigma factor FlgM [Photobacterium sp. 2_MG-2023]